MGEQHCGRRNLTGLWSNDYSPSQKLAIEKCDEDMDKFVEDIHIFFTPVSDPLDPISEDNPFLQQLWGTSEYIITAEAME